MPASTWMIVEILTRPALLADVKAELATAVTSTSPPSFDWSVLLELPLMNAIFKEVLRLRTAVFVYREAEEDIYIGETFIPKDAPIMAANWQANQSAELWGSFQTDLVKSYNENPNGSAPLQFDPSRFLAAEAIKADKKAPKEDRDRANAALNPNNFFPW